MTKTLFGVKIGNAAYVECNQNHDTSNDIEYCSTCGSSLIINDTCSNVEAFNYVEELFLMSSGPQCLSASIYTQELSEELSHIKTDLDRVDYVKANKIPVSIVINTKKGELEGNRIAFSSIDELYTFYNKIVEDVYFKSLRNVDLVDEFMNTCVLEECVEYFCDKHNMRTMNDN